MAHRWHKFQAWRGLHPGWLSYMAAAFFAVIGVTGMVLVFYFHAQENAKFSAQETARQTTAQLVKPVVCRLVYAYLHLPAATPNSARLVDAWHQVGGFVGCPAGNP